MVLQEICWRSETNKIDRLIINVFINFSKIMLHVKYMYVVCVVLIKMTSLWNEKEYLLEDYRIKNNLVKNIYTPQGLRRDIKFPNQNGGYSLISRNITKVLFQM